MSESYKSRKSGGNKHPRLALVFISYCVVTLFCKVAQKGAQVKGIEAASRQRGACR